MPLKKSPYDQDEDLLIRAEIYNDEDELGDPGTLTLEIVRPSGAIDSYSLADFDHPSTGIFEYTYRVPSEWGTYHGTWTATTTVRIPQQFSFRVRRPRGG